MTTTSDLTTDEQSRASHLLDAQNKAVKLFEQIERQLLRPNVSELALSKEIWELGKKYHNVRTHWHQRLVRSGPHTLQTASEPASDRIIQPDDILFVDLGPVFEAWEADFGRTYVLGHDPVKEKLRDSLEPVWNSVKSRWSTTPDITGDQLYKIACEEAKKSGFDFGGRIAGHLVGQFPHERIPRDKIRLYITDGNHERMDLPGKDGMRRHWILEIHLVDRVRQIGAFYEQLLTVG